MIIRHPRARMDGTHIPTNSPSSREPVNQRLTENMSDAKAANKKRLRAVATGEDRARTLVWVIRIWRIRLAYAGCKAFRSLMTTRCTIFAAPSVQPGLGS
jgi:hypothetical protein